MIKINVNKLIMDVLILLPLTTLFQSMIPAINRIIFFIIIILLLYMTIFNRHSMMEVIVLVLFSIVYFAAFIFTKEIAENTNEYFYLLFFMLFSDYVIRRYNYIKDYLHRKTLYIRRVVLVWDATVIISMFFKSSYDGIFFYSFTGNVFRSATAAVFILTLIMILVSKNMKDIIYAFVPLFCVFSGGSRTYLIIGIAIFLAICYMAIPNRKIFILSLVPLALIVVYVIINSSIMYKIRNSLTVSSTDYYQDFLFKFTSGRSLFWTADIKAFFEGKFINQIFGYGYNFVYDVNQSVIHNRIWAHNDFINILLNYGYIGLFCYICMFCMMYHHCVSQFRFPMWLKGIMVFVWFFNAFFNMFYTYVGAAASYPFILFSLSLFWEKKLKSKKVYREEVNLCS